MNQATTDDGSTPLFMASQNGHAAVVEALLGQEGIDVNQAQTDCNATALMCAAAEGHCVCVQLLLGAGADAAVVMTGVDEGIGGGAGMTALDLAKAKGHEPVADLLST